MARGTVQRIVELYGGGMSIPEVSDEVSLARSTVRYHLKRADVLRTRAEGVRNAVDRGRHIAPFTGKTRVFSDDHKAAIKRARQKWGEENAKGTRITSSGYIEFTRGPHKGRSEHVVKMEERIGRRLNSDECVHHIDGNRKNNDDNNLALMTTAGHARLHRREDTLQGNERRRNANGTWS